MPIGIPALLGITSGLGALGGLLNNTQGARTTTSNQTQTQTGTENVSGSTRRYLAPGQEEVMSPLIQSILSKIQNPAQGLEPLKTAAMGNVNKLYSGSEDILRQKFQRGVTTGSTGKLGRATRQLETDRLGKLGGLEGDFSKMALDELGRNQNLAMSLLGMNFGSDTTGQTTFDRTTNSQGTQVGPGSMLGGALGGASGPLSMLATLLSLNKLMMGGSGSGTSDPNWGG